jgi:hypothetical protein
MSIVRGKCLRAFGRLRLDGGGAGSVQLSWPLPLALPQAVKGTARLDNKRSTRWCGLKEAMSSLVVLCERSRQAVWQPPAEQGCQRPLPAR